MKTKLLPFILLFSVASCFTACKNQLEDFHSPSVVDYYPTEVGKYIIYRLDSLVFTQQGRAEEHHFYQQKDVIDAQITDAQGRPSYRVYRYLRDVDGTQPWAAAGTYMVTPTATAIEVVDNNMRTIRLAAPVKEGESWKGNRFLSSRPYSSLYLFNNDLKVGDWDFTYESIKDSYTYNQQTLNDVLKITQVNEIAVVDTVTVAGNTATIPQDFSSVWLRGTASDTVVISASKPTAGHEQLTVYNQTGRYAAFNKILIPPGVGLSFEFANDKWYYPNVLSVISNKVSIPRNASIAYILGTATADIEIDFSKIDLSGVVYANNVRKVTIYNKSNFNAYPKINGTASAVSIPPGQGRSYIYTLAQQWQLENVNILLTTDPYINETPVGSKNIGVEKYAKGIGPVYQELTMWEYNPNPSGTPYKIGFGVKRTMIDHN